MKYNKAQFLIALLGVALTFTSLATNADEAGFTLDESIRKQVFLELKSNVKNLYRNSYLSVPDIDNAASARITGRTAYTGFIFPLNHKTAYGKEVKTIDNIN